MKLYIQVVGKPIRVPVEVPETVKIAKIKQSIAHVVNIPAERQFFFTHFGNGVFTEHRVCDTCLKENDEILLIQSK